MIKVTKTNIEGVFVIEPTVFGDSRGYFMETYNQKDFIDAGITNDFVQDNQSKSQYGVLRGLHFQKTHPQAKLVRVLEGKVFDVAVDLRKGSPTYGEYVSEILSEENKKMLFIPRGFAHGFLVLSESAVFSYKCDDFYNPQDEGGILWNDKEVNIKWPFTENVLLSEKDEKQPSLKEAAIEFDL